MTYKNTSNQVTKTVDYRYDAFDQLVYRPVDPDGALGSATLTETAFVYEGGQVVLEFDGTGSGVDGDASHRYVWGPGVDMLLADEWVTEADVSSEVLCPFRQPHLRSGCVRRQAWVFSTQEASDGGLRAELEAGIVLAWRALADQLTAALNRDTATLARRASEGFSGVRSA